MLYLTSSPSHSTPPPLKKGNNSFQFVVLSRFSTSSSSEDLLSLFLLSLLLLYYFVQRVLFNFFFNLYLLDNIKRRHIDYCDDTKFRTGNTMFTLRTVIIAVTTWLLNGDSFPKRVSFIAIPAPNEHLFVFEKAKYIASRFISENRNSMFWLFLARPWEILFWKMVIKMLKPRKVP